MLLNIYINRMADVLVLPFPAQGHINPVLAFSKCLASKGLKITIITTSSVKKSIKSCPSITIETISDGSEEIKEPENIESYFKRLRASLSTNFAKFIDEKKSSSFKVIMYDSTMPWVLDIAHERGLMGASFFTQSCSVCAVYYHLRQGSLKYPYEDSTVSLDSLPTALEVDDLPCFSKFDDPKHLVVKHLVDEFSNIEKVDWIFFNTFDNLEAEIVEWMESKWPIKTIGPTSLLMSDNKLLPNDHKNQIISLLEQNYEPYTEWLDSKEPKSVVYVSLGSIASIGKEEMEELAYGLLMSNCYFLWVVRASEEEKLPPNFMTTSKKGLIVKWCNQSEVLAHHSIACFMTHCGWNSTLEALGCGVPLITMAQWVDQQTNAKFVEDVWRVGVRVKDAENGIFKREELARCIEEVTRGSKGMDLRRNVSELKELAREAVEKNGSSAKNIEDFVSHLLCN